MAEVVQIPGGPELEFDSDVSPEVRAKVIAEYTQRARSAMQKAEAETPRMAAAPFAAGAGYGMTPQPQSLAEEQGRFETARQMGGMAARVAPFLAETILKIGRAHV